MKAGSRRPGPGAAANRKATAIAVVLVVAAGLGAWAMVSGTVFNLYRGFILAIGGPILVYVLIKWLVLPRMSEAAKDVLPQEITEDLQRTLPTPFSWVTRIVIYGALAAILLPAIGRFLIFKTVTAEDECNARRPGTCTDQKTGILKSIPQLEARSPGGTAKPIIPCRFVGVWASGQGGRMEYRTALKDDGTYVMDPGPALPKGATGLWAVQGDKMVWRHGEGRFSGPDINAIQVDSITRFTLTEENGSHTEFNLVETMKSSTCTP